MRTINLKCLNTLLEADFDSTTYRVILLVLNSGELSKYTGRLLSTASEIYAVDGGGNYICELLKGSSCQLRIDSKRRVIGDLDSASEESIRTLKNDYGFLIEQRIDPDTTDFYKTFSYIQTDRKWQPGDIIIVDGLVGGRLDQTISNLAQLYQRDCHPALIIGLSRVNACCLIPAGVSQVLLPTVRYTLLPSAPEREPDRPVITEVVALLPLLPCRCVTTSGLRWNLREAQMNIAGLVSSSNEILPATDCIKIATDELILFYMRLT